MPMITSLALYIDNVQMPSGTAQYTDTFLHSVNKFLSVQTSFGNKGI